MTETLANYSAALKEVLLPYIQDNWNDQTPLLQQIKQDSSVEFINDNFYAPVRTSRHGGIVNLANDASKLRSGQANTARASVASKNITGTFDITSKAIKASANSKGAVESDLAFQAESLMKDFTKDLNRQYYSDGYGVVGQVGGSVGAGTLGLTAIDSNLDDARSIDWYGSVNGDIAVGKYLQPGMAIGIGTGAADVGTVTSVSGTVVVVTGAPAIVANDAIYKVDGDDALGGEIEGVRAALSSTTGTAEYAGLARNTNGWAPQLGTTAGALTLTEMEQKYLAAQEYAMKDDNYMILCNLTLYRKYGDMLTSLRRSVNTMDLVGGWKGLEFQAGGGKVGVKYDFECPDGEVVIINLDSWKLCQISDMSWSEEPNTGSLLRRRDYLTYQATMEWYANLICLAPGANARLTQKTY
jgi:hypothetical protein